MKEWRVIILLLAIVLLLGVILGIKIMNNTSEKQQTTQINEIKESSLQVNINEKNANGFFAFSIGISLIFLIGRLVLIVALIVAIIGIYKLCIKLEISPTLLKMLIFALIGLMISIVIINISRIRNPFFYKIPTILNISFFSFAILSVFFGVVFIGQFLSSLDIRFSWAMLLVIAPYVLCFIIAFFNPILSRKLEILISLGAFILNILVGIKLADRFEKNTIYKIGLSVFPLSLIFMPLLGFTAEE